MKTKKLLRVGVLFGSVALSVQGAEPRISTITDKEEGLLQRFEMRYLERDLSNLTKNDIRRWSREVTEQYKQIEKRIRSKEGIRKAIKLSNRLKNKVEDAIQMKLAEDDAADLNAQLSYAFSRGDLRRAKTLLLQESAANIPVNNQGMTTLMLAAAHGWPEVVSHLLKQGVNPFMTNLMGETALDLAQSDSIKEVLQEAMKKAAKQAIMEAQPDVPEDVAKLITDITYGEKPARSSIEDVD